MLKVWGKELVRIFYYGKRVLTLLERMKGMGVEPAEIRLTSRRDQFILNRNDTETYQDSSKVLLIPEPTLTYLRFIDS